MANKTKEKVAESATMEIMAAEAKQRQTESAEPVAVATANAEEVVEPVAAEELAEETAEPEASAEPAEETAEPEASAEPAEETAEPEAEEEPAEENAEPEAAEEPAEENAEPEAEEEPAEENAESEAAEEPAEEVAEPEAAEEPAEEPEETEAASAVCTMEPNNTAEEKTQKSGVWKPIVAAAGLIVALGLSFLLVCGGISMLRKPQADVDENDKPAVTTTVSDETTKGPSETTKAPDQTTAAPSESTTAPDETTTAPDETTAAPDETTKVPNETTVNPEDVNLEGFEQSVLYISADYNPSFDITAATYLTVDAVDEQQLRTWIVKYGKAEVAEAIAATLVFVPEIRGEAYIQQNGYTYNPNAFDEYWDKYYSLTEAYETKYGRSPDEVLRVTLKTAYETGVQSKILAAAKKALKSAEYADFEEWYLYKSGDAYDQYLTVVSNTEQIDAEISKYLAEIPTSAGLEAFLEAHLEAKANSKFTVLSQNWERTTEYTEFVKANLTVLKVGK